MKSETVKDLLKINSPLIIGHRGYKHLYPENTIEAFEKAVDAGCRVIELDVMFSKDREVVVIHDENLDRTTNGKGAVSDLTLSELKNLDAGSWFNEKFLKCKIPTLSEVFESVGSKTLVNVEIKPECYEENSSLETIEKKVLRLIGSLNMNGRVIISSFNGKIIRRIKELNPSIETAFIFEEVPDDLDEIVETGIFSVHIGQKSVKKEFVERMHEKGLKVFVWTVNSVDVFNELVGNGVDGIFTDNPGLFIK